MTWGCRTPYLLYECFHATFIPSPPPLAPRPLISPIILKKLTCPLVAKDGGFPSSERPLVRVLVALLVPFSFYKQNHKMYIELSNSIVNVIINNCTRTLHPSDSDPPHCFLKNPEVNTNVVDPNTLNLCYQFERKKREKKLRKIIFF